MTSEECTLTASVRSITLEPCTGLVIGRDVGRGLTLGGQAGGLASCTVLVIELNTCILDRARMAAELIGHVGEEHVQRLDGVRNPLLRCLLDFESEQLLEVLIV